MLETILYYLHNLNAFLLYHFLNWQTHNLATITNLSTINVVFVNISKIWDDINYKSNFVANLYEYING